MHLMPCQFNMRIAWTMLARLYDVHDYVDSDYEAIDGVLTIDAMPVHTVGSKILCVDFLDTTGKERPPGCDHELSAFETGNSI